MTLLTRHAAAGILLLGAALALAGCDSKTAAPKPGSSAAPAASTASAKNPKKAPPPKENRGPAAIAHGGVGSPPERSQVVSPAVRKAMQRLAAGDSALDAAVAGTVVLEDEPTLNAGTGANVRLDGFSVQMDAAVMDSEGRFGGVAVIEGVKNPIQVARAVIDTPHTLLAGDGATAFARARGFAEHDPATKEARAKRDRAVKTLLGKGDTELPPGWQGFDWRRHYDHQRKLRKAGAESFDTVGVLVRHADGSFAGGLSTGGTTLTLRGRVGDVPIQGAGLYVGAEGGVACTGNGEDIVKHLVARKVYERIAGGASLKEAVDWGVASFPKNVSLGVIAIDREAEYAAANRSMAWALQTKTGARTAQDAK